MLGYEEFDKINTGFLDKPCGSPGRLVSDEALVLLIFNLVVVAS